MVDTITGVGEYRKRIERKNGRKPFTEKQKLNRKIYMTKWRKKKKDDISIKK